MIRSFDYLKILPEIEEDLIAATTRVLRSGRLILGQETEKFEHEFAAFVGARHCIGVASGTAALHLALMALGIGPGDEVITVSNTCVPTIAAIRLTGAQPVFVDVHEDDLMIDVGLAEQAITSKTRCLLPVHLWGRSADLPRLTALSDDCGVSLVEDCAQAIGTTCSGRQVGTFGNIGCFSFYPTKNLGALGDAGAVVTNRDDLADRLKRLRLYGYDDWGESVIEGTNARISEMQAAILRVKLRYFPDWLVRRRRVAAAYSAGIKSRHVILPPPQPGIMASWHQYVVRTSVRQELMAALHSANIEYAIHYPMPVHLMSAYQHFGASRPMLPVTVKAAQEILSLPIHEAISSEEAQKVILTINQYGADK